jgi:hypothetical protein
LKNLVTSPQKQVAFYLEPDTLMETFDLTEEDKVLIKSAQKNKLSAAFTSECTILAVACFDPGEDPLPDPDPPSDPDSSKKK